MTDNGGNDRRRDIEGRINTLGTSNDGLSARGGNRGHGASRDGSAETDGVGSALTGDDEDDDTASVETDAEAITDDDSEGDADEGDAEERPSDGTASDELDADESESVEDDADADDGDTGSDVDAEEDAPFESRAADIDDRSSLEIEMDRFVRAFAARRAENVGEDSLDDYIVGSVKGYLAGLLGGDVESPDTMEREVEIEADEIFGGLLGTVVEDDQDTDDVVIAAVAEAHDVPEEDSLIVAGLRDHEALLNGVVANSSNGLDDVSAVVQAAVETRLTEERAD